MWGMMRLWYNRPMRSHGRPATNTDLRYTDAAGTALVAEMERRVHHRQKTLAGRLLSLLPHALYFLMSVLFWLPSWYVQIMQDHVSVNLCVTLYNISNIVPFIPSLGYVIFAQIKIVWSIMHERQQSTWDSLLITPLDSRDILAGKLFNVSRPIFVTTIATSLIVFSWSVTQHFEQPAAYFSCYFTQAALVYYASSVGVFSAIISKHHAVALVRALLILCGSYILMLMFVSYPGNNTVALIICACLFGFFGWAFFIYAVEKLDIQRNLIKPIPPGKELP